MLPIVRLAVVLCALVPAQATTLRRASLDDLIQTSTSIVRARVTGSSTVSRGPLVYTHYAIQVLDRWKGAVADRVDVQVPVADGAPHFNSGSEYVFFLWTGPSGANHVLGLSQGALDVTTDAVGNIIVVRQASEALGSQDSLQMKLSDFAGKVNGALKGSSASK
jgi:hypothetical protein